MDFLGVLEESPSLVFLGSVNCDGIFLSSLFVVFFFPCL